MSFANKVIVITGAASGIGEGTAKHFSKLSPKLSLMDINGESLQKVAEECKNLGAAEVLTSVFDITNDEEVKNAVENTIKEFGRIDVLINNAGITSPGMVTDDDLMENFDKVMAVNMRAVLAITHFVAPELIKTKGCVVNISSVDAKLVVGGVIPYYVSKAALCHFNKCVALELAPKEVRVNSIVLGAVKTNLLSSLSLTEEAADEVWDYIRKVTPTKRFISIEEVNDLIEYLASDKARSVTGADYTLDGGILLTGIPQGVADDLNE